mgnify:CR=1 FL=1
MKIYRLHKKQNLPITVNEAWDFLSDPKNLKTITPDYMGFNILPYALWHHKHFIKEIEGGVEMEDIIDYKVPFGIIGQMVHPFLVKPILEEIFNYRTKKLEELYGTYSKK